MKTELLTRLNDLKRDIIHPEGMQVTQSQNYPFSIFVYRPVDEFVMRENFQNMILDIKKKDIEVLEINLAHECIEIAKKVQDDWTIDEIIQKEKEFFEEEKNYKDSFPLVEDFFTPILEKENGISLSIQEKIEKFKNDLEGRKGVVFITRAGFLYPFYRTSSLLKFLTNTRGLPVIFLYPGARTSDTSLSYMEIMSPDSNYRPRMY